MKEQIEKILDSWVIDSLGASEPYISACDIEEIAEEIENKLKEET